MILVIFSWGLGSLGYVFVVACVCCFCWVGLLIGLCLVSLVRNGCGIWFSFFDWFLSSFGLKHLLCFVAEGSFADHGLASRLNKSTLRI